MLKFLQNKSTYEIIIRYLLGLGMLPYGLTKIFRTQFVVLPFYSWSEPLKDISGTTLTWAFLGYSHWFTILLGFLEAVPSVLLLFRKTKLLGALLLFPVVLNVYLINIALDLWPSTQKISALMLLMNIILLLFHYQLIQEFFKRVLNHLILNNKRVELEAIVNAVLIGTVSALSITGLMDYIGQRNFLTGDWYNDRPNYWIEKKALQEERQRYTPTSDENYIRYYFQPYQGAYMWIPGSKQPIYKKYHLDESNHMLTIFDGRDSSNVIKGSYKLIDGKTLEWNTENGEDKLFLIKKELE